jgi:hypothetical protein
VRLSLRDWGTKHLLIAWSAYWLALGVATLKPALDVLGRLGRVGAHGQASAAVQDGLLRVTITSTDGPAWTGAIHLSSLVLWVVGPPLVLWLLWAVSRPRRDVAATPSAPDAGLLRGRSAGGAGARGETVRSSRSDDVVGVDRDAAAKAVSDPRVRRRSGPVAGTGDDRQGDVG